MKILNTSLLLGAAIAILAVAPVTTPAAAQTVGARHHDWSLGQREDWLRERLDMSRNNGALTLAEYNRASDSLHAIRVREDGLRDDQNGRLMPDQRQMLEARLDGVARHIHWANATAMPLPW